MKYIIMCGGKYLQWSTPRQLMLINGESVAGRTLRLLKEAGIDDIYISTNDKRYERLGVPILSHKNDFVGYVDVGGSWVEAFYPTDEPACYLMGDVVFSPEAIRTIVETDTDDVEFFASAPPVHPLYTKPWAEPFAFKVVNQKHFREAINTVKVNETTGLFKRRPIAWELWQIVKGTPINQIITNYTVINDYTCDIDNMEDIQRICEVMK